MSTYVIKGNPDVAVIALPVNEHGTRATKSKDATHVNATLQLPDGSIVTQRVACANLQCVYTDRRGRRQVRPAYI